MKSITDRIIANRAKRIKSWEELARYSIGVLMGIFEDMRFYRQNSETDSEYVARCMKKIGYR